MKKIIMAIFLILLTASRAWASTATFYISTGNDDGYLYGDSYSGVPPYSNYDKTNTQMDARKWLYSGSEYFNDLALFRFDTSSIPDNATITNAILHLYAKYTSTSGGRYVNGEYYVSTFGFSSSQYTTSDLETTAFQVSLSSFSTGATTEISLNNLTNINKTGYTAFRLGVPGTITSSREEIDIATFEHSSKGPVLVITYTTGYAHKINSISSAAKVNGIAVPAKVNGI